MGSIAYITDKNMMEYHRLHGNSVINFWKPSIKSITDFKKGDMLFFLTKGTERGKKEKREYLDMVIFESNKTWGLHKCGMYIKL